MLRKLPKEAQLENGGSGIQMRAPWLQGSPCNHHVFPFLWAKAWTKKWGMKWIVTQPFLNSPGEAQPLHHRPGLRSFGNSLCSTSFTPAVGLGFSRNGLLFLFFQAYHRRSNLWIPAWQYCAVCKWHGEDSSDKMISSTLQCAMNLLWAVSRIESTFLVKI